MGSVGAARSLLQYFGGLSSSEVVLMPFIGSGLHITHSYSADPRKLGWVYVTSDRKGWLWSNVWSLELYGIQAECKARGAPCNMQHN
jgi:hypothetical protein